MMNRLVLSVSCTIFMIGYNLVSALNTISMETSGPRVTVKDPSWGSLSSGILKSHMYFYYETNSDKTIVLSTTVGNGIVASIRMLDLRPYCQDTLTLFDAANPFLRNLTSCNTKHMPYKTVDEKEKKSFYVSSGSLGVRFKTNPGTSVGYGGFQLTYTTVSKPPCLSHEFRCYESRCIANVLRCDGHNHCGDQSDDNSCGLRIYPGKVIGIVFGVVFVLIAIFCGIYLLRRRNSRRTVQTVVTTHPPSYPSYPTGTYPPPPPPYTAYTQGHSNPVYR